MSDPPRKIHSSLSAIAIGMAAAVLGAIILFAPLLLGQWEYSKYIVVCGFLLGCLGLGIVLNALIDLLRGKK